MNEHNELECLMFAKSLVNSSPPHCMSGESHGPLCFCFVCHGNNMDHYVFVVFVYHGAYVRGITWTPMFFYPSDVCFILLVCIARGSAGG